MIINPSIFRAYDIRGIYPDQLNEEVVYAIAKNADTLFKKESLIIVGHDTRTNGDQLARMVARGLKEAGMRVVEVGLMSTPMATFLIRAMKAQGAMVVTASHSPAQFNGIKCSNSEGVAIGGQAIYTAMKERFSHQEWTMENVVDLSDRPLSNQYAGDYVQWLGGLWTIRRPLSVVCDASNGATGHIVEQLAEYMEQSGVPIKWTLINTNPDPQFSAHGPDPTVPKAWEQIRTTIRKTKADIGVILDGDGDRAVIFDETGAVVRPEYVWRLLLIGRSGSACVYDATVGYMTAQLVNQLQNDHNRKVSVHESKVGHLFITEAMHNHRATLGFESSGHYYFPEIGGVSSGLAATLAAVSVLSEMPYSLNTYTTMLPASYRATEVDVVSSNNWDDRKSRIQQYADQHAMRVSTKDGISIMSEAVWINARPSNTSDVIRVNAEGNDRKEVDSVMKEIIALIRG